MRNAITVREAMNLLSEHGMVLKHDTKDVDGEFCVNYKHGCECTAYYSDDLEDVVVQGIRKSEQRMVKEIGRRNKAALHLVQS